MTDAAASKEPARAAVPPRSHRPITPIVPSAGTAGNAMLSVIAIMTFLSCLTLGAVSLVRDTAATWQTQIAREATIQIKPVEGLDMDAALSEAAALAGGFAGVRSATIVDQAATKRLLEPWLGSDFDIEELPVPRLVIIAIDPGNPPDFAAMRQGAWPRRCRMPRWTITATGSTG